MLIENTTWKFRLKPEEKEKLCMKIAAQMRDAELIREALKIHVSLEKERIKQIEKEIHDKLDTLTAGEEQRPANLRIEFDRPQPGQKEIYDNDTGELLAVRDMTEDDRQDLFVHAETQEQQPPAEEHPKAGKKRKMTCTIKRAEKFGQFSYDLHIYGFGGSSGFADTYRQAVQNILDALENFDVKPGPMKWTDEVEHTASLAEAIAKLDQGESAGEAGQPPRHPEADVRPEKAGGDPCRTA